MNYEAITLEDCIVLFFCKGIRTIIRNGKARGFERDFKEEGDNCVQIKK